MTDERQPIALLPQSTRSTASPLSWAEALRKASQLPPPANDGKIIIPTPEEYQQATRGFIGPQQEMSKRKRRLRIHAVIGNHTPTQPSHKRYIVKLKDKNSGKERVGKVITSVDIEEWAQKNGYAILRSFRIWSHVNSEKEFTELTE
jgi:hypothetical protein